MVLLAMSDRSNDLDTLEKAIRIAAPGAHVYCFSDASEARRFLEEDNDKPDQVYPLADDARNRIRFQCFGNFEVFADGKPMNFQHEKTKELLAYLVDRRTVCTNAEIIAVIWEGAISDSYFRLLRKDLVDTFKAAGCEDVLIRQWAKIGIDAEKVDCDYYEWRSGRPGARSTYLGEYMTQYSWAEFTNARLNGEIRGN